MINRSLIRRKVVQLLYARMFQAEKSIDQLENELELSVEKANDLFGILLILPDFLVKLGATRIENNLNKLLPSHDDLNPNYRFIENKYIQALNNNVYYTGVKARLSYFWEDQIEFVSSLMSEIVASPFFANYMTTKDGSYEADRLFIKGIYKTFIFNNPDLLLLFEDVGIYWNDDVEVENTFLIKVLNKFTEECESNIFSQDRESMEEVLNFGRTILNKALVNKTTFEDEITGVVDNWEISRIASMDVLIMCCAMAEFRYIDSNPVNTTLNEYIEIAKEYSTVKSSAFINGVLDKIVSNYRVNKVISK